MSNKKTKLHQILAVEDDRKRTAMEILNESIGTFKTKKDHFEGVTRVYDVKEEGSEEYPTERKELITTVKEKLDYTAKHWAKYLDIVMMREQTNSSGVAKASVQVGDKFFGEYGATTLLAIEKNLTQFILMLREVPTLDPAHEWIEDDQNSNRFISKHPSEQNRTQKKSKPIVMYEATKEHPAQVVMETYDTIVGKWTGTRTSGKIRPADKATMLDRAEELLIAVKKARTAANECEVVTANSNVFFDHIING